jgi:hypothetical protein
VKVKIDLIIRHITQFLDIEQIIKRNKLTGSPQLNQRRLIQRMGTSDRLLGSSTKTDSFDEPGRETPSKKLIDDVSLLTKQIKHVQTLVLISRH